MAHASFELDDSLLLPDGSSSSMLSSLPILYPPSSTLPFPSRPHAHRPSPPAIDPDLPPSDLTDTHSLLNSPTEHSRSAMPASALPDGSGDGADDDDGQDSDAGLDDDQFREKMEREILGPPGEMGREEEKVARRAWELGSRIMRAELAVRQADVHPYDPQEDLSPTHSSSPPPPPTKQTLVRLLRSLEYDEWRYGPEAMAVQTRANADFVPYEWIGRAPSRKKVSASAIGGMMVDTAATTARECPRM